MSLNTLAVRIHENARYKGFYDREFGNPSFASERLLLVVSEVAEAQDALRDGDVPHEMEEVADAIIRLLDYSAWRGFDIERAIVDKMAKNAKRPHLHGRGF